MTSLTKFLCIFILASCSSLSEIKSNLPTINTIGNVSSGLDNSDYTILVNKGFLNNHIFNANKKDETFFHNEVINSSIKFCGIKICFYKLDNFEFKININEVITISNILNGSLDNKKSYIKLKNPDSSYLTYSSSYLLIDKIDKLILLNDVQIPYFLIEESFYVPKIRWRGKNLYYFNKSNNEIIKVEQSISPLLKPLVIFFNT
tara:strand:+ start:159 stop:770 length:612 start_codon:yes stop_codon:yes gene_type:complete